MIDVENYTKKFKKFVANDNVTFKVGHGVIHGFIGPNGSGKTTTMKTLVGAYTLQKGRMSINGHKPGTAVANSLIGYIPERSSFPAHLNCISYLSEMGALSGLKYKAAKKRGWEILEDLGMRDFARRKPIAFSSGMQKKILLAQALLTDPSILILDEPTANLDPTARKELLDEIIKMRDRGKTIFISSHILSDLERVIDEVTFIFYGTILYTGAIEGAALETQRAFFRTTDNALVREVLRKAGYVVRGDVKTEMFVECASMDESEQLLRVISAIKEIKVVLFKTNDLQTVYDHLLSTAIKRGVGAQRIGAQKVSAQHYAVEDPEKAVPPVAGGK